MADSAPHSAPTRLVSHLLVLLLATFVASNLAHAASAYIRVNQVGYPGSSTKRAYLMASGAETGATFVVKNSSGTTVYSSAVGASLGAWGTFSSVYALDFDSVSTAGTYFVKVRHFSATGTGTRPSKIPCTMPAYRS